ncbi:uncharacterized protein [Oscarella lobularis]|uniref:uncharacterized protein n=1 Tax=Oscarella lobularis TaxID=121494 RepID=UPI0033137CDD
MSALQLFEVASGITWSFVSVPNVKAVAVNLSFAPRLTFTNYRGFFILATCYGQYVQIGDANLASGTAQVSVTEGDLVLNQLQIKSTASAATATVSHKPVEAKVSQNEGVLTLAFTAPVALHTSEAIAINIG